MKRRTIKLLGLMIAATISVSMIAGCGSQSVSTSDSTSASSESGEKSSAEKMSNEEIIKKAAGEGKVGNWGLGNEYEVKALLAKYGLPTDYLSQDFTMDGFDDDSITLASAMTYNELGLVKNSYDGGYGYGDEAGIIDMNDEGVAMLEDNIFCSRKFASENPNTVKAFLYASLKGWEYAAANPEEAAQICFEAGSSVSEDHQKYMADEAAKLVSTDMSGNKVTDDIGKINDTAMQQTLDIAKKYVTLDDSSAQEKLKNLTLDDIRDTSYYDAAKASADGKFDVEKKDVSIQLKWLPDAQFMGYYVAKAKGYYDEAGINVNIVSGGGDISETTAVNNGTVDFGVTWPTNMAVADAGGMDLVEIAQIFQRSGLTLVYKYKNFEK